MRIYKRSDFLKLPEGTLFCKGRPWYWGTLHVKGESLSNDFIDCDLCWIDDDDNNDFSVLDGMLENGDSVPMATDYGRDGCFNDEDIFLVFESTDLEVLKKIIDTAIQAETKAET